MSMATANLDKLSSEKSELDDNSILEIVESFGEKMSSSSELFGEKNLNLNEKREIALAYFLEAISSKGGDGQQKVNGQQLVNSLADLLSAGETVTEVVHQDYTERLDIGGEKKKQHSKDRGLDDSGILKIVESFVGKNSNLDENEKNVLEYFLKVISSKDGNGQQRVNGQQLVNSLADLLSAGETVVGVTHQDYAAKLGLYVDGSNIDNKGVSDCRDVSIDIEHSKVVSLQKAVSENRKKLVKLEQESRKFFFFRNKDVEKKLAEGKDEYNKSLEDLRAAMISERDKYAENNTDNPNEEVQENTNENKQKKINEELRMVSMEEAIAQENMTIELRAKTMSGKLVSSLRGIGEWYKNQNKFVKYGVSATTLAVGLACGGAGAAGAVVGLVGGVRKFFGVTAAAVGAGGLAKTYLDSGQVDQLSADKEKFEKLSFREQNEIIKKLQSIDKETEQHLSKIKSRKRKIGFAAITGAVASFFAGDVVEKIAPGIVENTMSFIENLTENVDPEIEYELPTEEKPVTPSAEVILSAEEVPIENDHLIDMTTNTNMAEQSADSMIQPEMPKLEGIRMTDATHGVLTIADGDSIVSSLTKFLMTNKDYFTEGGMGWDANDLRWKDIKDWARDRAVGLANEIAELNPGRDIDYVQAGEQLKLDYSNKADIKVQLTF